MPICVAPALVGAILCKGVFLMRDQHIRNLVRAAVLAAVSLLLMLPMFEIPMSFFAPWLKLDFSTIPVLLAGFALGPVWGIAVQGVKSLLHWPVGTTQGVGEIADFLVGCAMMLPAALIYMRGRTRKNALIGLCVGVACMVPVAMLTNYFLLIPFFEFIMGVQVVENMATYITMAVLPFNLIKGVAVGGLTFLLYRYVRRFLHDAREIK